ncbi:MAG: hypothetical protein EOP47_17645 [Sphingobacteriaceae bacterium]|nr:MAG: hypothetical protein EOP47_17645 [Sphingobacteriaceae bacterium]
MEKLPITSLLEIFDELYIGVKNKEQTWVIDSDPGEGFIDTIRNISAEDASRPLYPGGSTLAAHTEHLRWSLNFALEFLHGKKPDGDWDKSWTVKKVNDEEWDNLQSALHNEYKAVRAGIEAIPDWTNPFLLKGTLALLPHAAYHLGAIRQKMLALQH